MFRINESASMYKLGDKTILVVYALDGMRIHIKGDFIASSKVFNKHILCVLLPSHKTKRYISSGTFHVFERAQFYIMEILCQSSSLKAHNKSINPKVVHLAKICVHLSVAIFYWY